MKLRTLLLTMTMTALCAAGAGVAGVSAMNWRLKAGDRVHISMVWGAAAAGSLAPLAGYGAGLMWTKRRKERELDQLEAEVHQTIEDHRLQPDEQAPILIALSRLRGRSGGGKGN